MTGRVEQEQSDEPREQEGAHARHEPVGEVGAGEVVRQAVGDPAVEGAVDGPHQGDRAEEPAHRVPRAGEQHDDGRGRQQQPGQCGGGAEPGRRGGTLGIAGREVQPRGGGDRCERRQRRRRRARGVCSREQYHRAGVPSSGDRGPSSPGHHEGTGDGTALPVGRGVGTAMVPVCRRQRLHTTITTNRSHHRDDPALSRPARSDVATAAPEGSHAPTGRSCCTAGCSPSAPSPGRRRWPSSASTPRDTARRWRSRCPRACSRSVCSSCSAPCGAPGPSARVVSPAPSSASRRSPSGSRSAPPPATAWG